MKLQEVISEIEKLEAERESLTKKVGEITNQVEKLGKALSQATRHLCKPGSDRVEFQSGDRQYAIESGVLTRINEVETISSDTEIKV